MGMAAGLVLLGIFAYRDETKRYRVVGAVCIMTGILVGFIGFGEEAEPTLARQQSAYQEFKSTYMYHVDAIQATLPVYQHAAEQYDVGQMDRETFYSEIRRLRHIVEFHVMAAYELIPPDLSSENNERLRAATTDINTALLTYRTGYDALLQYLHEGKESYFDHAMQSLSQAVMLVGSGLTALASLESNLGF